IIANHGSLSVPRACHYVSQAALGLQHAHAAGWVHRDIKPGNLLLDRAGIIKILDMGLARFFTAADLSASGPTDKAPVLGTSDYIAPEQTISSSTVDIRADIYSLGATFYFLLAGRAPFENGTVSQKLQWHQVKDPDAIRILRPDVPAALDKVIGMMMAKKPA